MLKKAFVTFLVVFLVALAAVATASIGIKISGVHNGIATDVDFGTGFTTSFDGSTMVVSVANYPFTGGNVTNSTIENCTIGATTPSTGKFTTLNATGNGVIGGTLGITGNTNVNNKFNVTASSGNFATDGTMTAAGTITTSAGNMTLTDGNVVISSSSKGLYLKSSNSTVYKINITDDGNLTATAI